MKVSKDQHLKAERKCLSAAAAECKCLFKHETKHFEFQILSIYLIVI